MISKDDTVDDLILVTGGGGFIGSNIAHKLAMSQERVVVCDDLGCDGRWLNLRGAALHDVVTISALPSWLERNADRLAGVVHMGAISATTEQDVDLIVERNIRSSLDLWDVCTRHQLPFVYASSAATYGNGDAGFDDVSELKALTRLIPLNPYGWSKHFCDLRFLRDHEEGRPTPPSWAGLKFFNVYGPHESHKESMRSVIHQIRPQVENGHAVRLFKSDHPDYPNGGQLRDFVHVDDCVHFALTALRAPNLAGVYNVGTGQARSFADLALATFSAVGTSPQIEYVDMPERLRGRYQYFTEATMERGRAAGLASNFIPLEDGVKSYVDWLQANPDF